jgi:methionyl-tRNA synthetase
MHKLCNGKVPVLHKQELTGTDDNCILEIGKSAIRVSQLIEEFKFRDALYEVIDLSRKGNKYMQDKEPWIVAKSLTEHPGNQKIIDNCLHICLQLTANLGILLNPFLPNTAAKLCYLLKVTPKMLEWEHAGKMNLLSTGYSLRAPELLFRKLEDEEIAVQVNKLREGSVQKQKEIKSQKPVMEAIKKEEVLKPIITFEDFSKIDFKTGIILKAEKVEKADKLLKLEVDLGFETRIIVSGIAQHFTPEAIIGKQVTVVTNLAPRKMRGIESAGMILMATDAGGKLFFVQPDHPIPPGSVVS